MTTNPHLSERGQTLILFIFAVAALMAATGIVIDVGMYLHERTRLQNAADAAALAGARMLPEEPSEAELDAAEWAFENGIGEGELEAVQVSTGEYQNDTIRVDVSRNVDFFFGGFLGILGDDVVASATARTGSLTGSAGLAPFAVEQNVFDGLQPGDSAILKYNATNSSNGNFLPLALDAPGAAEFKQNVMSGSDQWLCAPSAANDQCTSVAETQTGNVIGPIEQALQWIISNTSTACDSYEEVFREDPLAEGWFVLTPECNRFTNPSAASYRIVLIPVIDGLCVGHCEVHVQAVAMFFLESYTCSGPGQGNSCDLIGRYAQANANVQGVIGTFDPEASVNFVRLTE